MESFQFLSANLFLIGLLFLFGKSSCTKKWIAIQYLGIVFDDSAQLKGRAFGLYKKSTNHMKKTFNASKNMFIDENHRFKHCREFERSVNKLVLYEYNIVNDHKGWKFICYTTECILETGFIMNA